MVKVLVDPVQEELPYVKVGVTTMVATTGALPVLVAVNDAMFPEPLDANPILGRLFAQVYVVVPTVLTVLKFTAAVGALLQTT